jgi:L-rhamnose mutarotase
MSDVNSGPTLPLVEDGIRRYDELHASVWPEVVADHRRAGIRTLHIYRDGRNLFMVAEADDAFQLEHWGSHLTSERTAEWLQLTDPLQVPLADASLGTTWRLLPEVCHVHAID